MFSITQMWLLFFEVMVYKIQYASESPEELAKTHCWVPPPVFPIQSEAMDLMPDLFFSDPDVGGLGQSFAKHTLSCVEASFGQADHSEIQSRHCFLLFPFGHCVTVQELQFTQFTQLYRSWALVTCTRLGTCYRLCYSEHFSGSFFKN